MKNLIFGTGASAYKEYEGLKDVCRTAVINGIFKFDTAPSYRTEEFVSKALAEIIVELNLYREDFFFQTKIDPIQMYEGDVFNYFKRKLQKLNLDYVDSLLIHWPLKKYFDKTWDDISRLKELGLVRKMGICNLRITHLDCLYSKGIIPEILQIERHPLNTFEKELVFCRTHNIELQDYSPLCKMNPLLKSSKKLNDIASHHNKNIGQIILRWHIDTGATPVFTSKNVERINQYSEIDNFCLTKDEINEISSLNINHKLYLESLVCPGF